MTRGNKTCIFGVVLVLAVSVGAYAGISINYYTQAAVSRTASAGGGLLPIGSEVELIWSADAFYATPLPGTDISAGSQYAEGDYVLYESLTAVAGGFSNPDGGTIYHNADVGGQTILNGYVYVYVFPSDNHAADAYYGRSVMVNPPLNDVEGSPPGQPNALNVSPSAGPMVIGPVGEGGQGWQIVPEPGTMGLFALGLFPMMARCFRKK